MSKLSYIVILLLLILSSSYFAAQADLIEVISTQGRWVNSDELKPGMKILTADNQLLIVS